MFFLKYPSHIRVTIDPESIREGTSLPCTFKLTAGYVDTALSITLCLVSIQTALLARILSNLSYCDVGEIGKVGSTFAPPCDPQEQELLV